MRQTDGKKGTRNKEGEMKREIVDQETCKHPARRVYTWFAYDGTLCAGCCDCGKVLAGGVE